MDESTGKAGDGVPTPVADGGAGGIVPMAEGSKKRSPNRLIVDEATNDDNRYAWQSSERLLDRLHSRDKLDKGGPTLKRLMLVSTLPPLFFLL